MPTLTPSTLEEFLGRFVSFHDSVLRSVQVTYAQGHRHVTARIAVRDSQARDGRWVCVRLEILDVQAFCVSDSENTSAAVISHGVHIGWFDDIVAIEFGAFVDPPESLSAFKTSPLFAVGTSIEWSLEAY